MNPNCKYCLRKQPNIQAAPKDPKTWVFPDDFECASAEPHYPDCAHACREYVFRPVRKVWTDISKDVDASEFFRAVE